jgi:hypothetical protein
MIYTYISIGIRLNKKTSQMWSLFFSNQLALINKLHKFHIHFQLEKNLYINLIQQISM